MHCLQELHKVSDNQTGNMISLPNFDHRIQIVLYTHSQLDNQIEDWMESFLNGNLDENMP